MLKKEHQCPITRGGYFHDFINHLCNCFVQDSYLEFAYSNQNPFETKGQFIWNILFIQYLLSNIYFNTRWNDLENGI